MKENGISIGVFMNLYEKLLKKISRDSSPTTFCLKLSTFGLDSKNPSKKDFF